MLYSSLRYACDSGVHRLYSLYNFHMFFWLFCNGSVTDPACHLCLLQDVTQRWKSDFTHNSAYKYCNPNMECQWNQGNSRRRSVYLHPFCLIVSFTNPRLNTANNLCSTEQQHFFWYDCVFTAKFVSFSLWPCRVTSFTHYRCYHVLLDSYTMTNS